VVVPVWPVEEMPSSAAQVASPGGGHPGLPNPGEGLEMAQSDLVVRRVNFKIVEKWEFEDEGHKYDWEVLAGGKRYLHREDKSLRKGWICREQSKTIEIDKPEILGRLRDVVKQKLAKYANGKVSRATSGVIKLRYKGYVWKRGDFDGEGRPCAGRFWSRQVIGNGTEEWRPESKEQWGTLNQKVAELPDPMLNKNPKTSSKRKRPAFAERNKHGGLIIHSLADSRYYTRFDIGKSKKYRGGFTFRVNRGKLYILETLDRESLAAIEKEISWVLRS
jgi:hypothetical protein